MRKSDLSQVDGELWDLERVLEGPCKLEFLDFDHPEGKRVFWHSSAHVLGEAAELHYGCHLCIGPPTQDGFFYEMAIEDRSVFPRSCPSVSLTRSRSVSQADYPALERLSEAAIKERQKFERLVLSKEKLLKMFNVSRNAADNMPLTRSAVQQVQEISH